MKNLRTEKEQICKKIKTNQILTQISIRTFIKIKRVYN